ncbi:MAG: hypothetical protein AAGG48_17280 [Planctomycetota bacterium]
MFPRSVTSLLLATLLILQSVIPCCAVSKLLPDGKSTESVATQVAHSCSCCPHSQSQQSELPSDDGHSPDGKCPYCGGLLFHSGVSDATAASEGQLAFALLGDAPKHAIKLAPVFPQTLQQQVFGQPFLNTGMRLLI